MGIFNKIASLFSSEKDNEVYELNKDEYKCLFTGVGYLTSTPTQYALYNSGFYFNYDDAEFFNNEVLKEKANDVNEEYKMSFGNTASGKGYLRVGINYCNENGYKLYTKEDISIIESLKNKYFDLKKERKLNDENEAKYKDLLSCAVQFKKDKNINGAIDKTKEALLFYDEKLKKVQFQDNISGVIQLAKYLKDNKNYDEAWKIIDNKGMEVEETCFRYKRNYESLREMYSLLIRLKREALLILKKEKKITDYYFYLSEFMYLELVKNAFDGNSKKLNIIFDKYELLNNIELKMINDEVLKNEWHLTVLKFLNDKKELLLKISKEIEKWENVDHQKIKKWDNSTNIIEIGNYYNKTLSQKMSILK